MVGFVETMAASRLQRQIHRRADRLTPSIELPMPPWGPEIADELVDVASDVLVLQATLVGARTWQLDDVGAGLRREALANAASIRDRCAAGDLAITSETVRFLESSLRAWDSLSRR